MCMSVQSWEKYETLPNRYMWKVVNKRYKELGPIYGTEFEKDGWAKKVKVTTKKIKGLLLELELKQTHKGYHVFLTKFAAQEYRDFLERHFYIHNLKVARVQVKGRSIKFTWGDNKGYAVETWK